MALKALNVAAARQWLLYDLTRERHRQTVFSNIKRMLTKDSRMVIVIWTRSGPTADHQSFNAREAAGRRIRSGRKGRAYLTADGWRDIR